MHLLFILLFSLLPMTTLSANMMNYQVDTNLSSIVVKGDSTLHKWKMEAREFEGHGEINSPITKDKDIRTFELKVKSTQLISEDSKMDTKAHEALKSDTFPEIIYSLQSVTVLSEPSSGGLQKIQAIGNLMIAGSITPIESDGQLQIKDNAYIISGIQNLKMTSFGIKPPKFLFLKADNQVTVVYQLYLVERNKIEY